MVMSENTAHDAPLLTHTLASVVTFVWSQFNSGVLSVCLQSVGVVVIQ